MKLISPEEQVFGTPFKWLRQTPPFYPRRLPPLEFCLSRPRFSDFTKTERDAAHELIGEVDALLQSS